MPSFDIVSRIDLFEVDNALNNTRKAIANRYDFRGSTTEINFDPKEKKLKIVTEDNMKMQAVREMFLSHAAKRGLDLKSFKFSDPLPGAGTSLKREVQVNEGIPQDLAKQIVKLIKENKLKVQASIQGEEVRVTGKQIDDLQAVMAKLRESNLEIPLQFINMKK